MTPNYQVRVYLNSLSYEIEAESEDKAIEIAYDHASNESHYDLLKRADYEVEEVTNG